MAAPGVCTGGTVGGYNCSQKIEKLLVNCHLKGVTETNL